MKYKRFEFTFELLKTEIKHIEQFIGKMKKRGIKLICNENEILKDFKDALKELEKL